MNPKCGRRLLAGMLVVVMLMLHIPTIVFAEMATISTPEAEKYFNVISQKNYSLAPGATESTIIVNDKTGANQNIGHAIVVDPSNPSVSLMAGYSDMDPTVWKQQVTTQQCAAAEEKYGVNVIGAINTNLSWASNEPIGMLVINGVVHHEELISYGYFVMTKDGKAELRDGMTPLKGNEQQAVSGFGWIVKDGANLYPTADHTAFQRAPRTCIGIKADGSVVLYVVDGRQAPASAGMTMHELAETMIDLGCVDAINCDGGGSSTFVTEREGSGELSIKNSPSDGSERPTLGTLMVISTAKPDGEFHHASITPNDELYTPGSAIQFEALGVDSAGGAAPLPEDGTWALAADSTALGTIDAATGRFVANADAVGKVTAQFMSNGEVVGSASIDLVKPDSITFLNEEMSLGFEESSNLNIMVKYQGVDVNYKVGDIVWTLSNPDMGTFTDDIFTSSDGKTINGTVTATSAYDENLSATMKLIIGMLPTIVWDFEDRVDPETGAVIPAEEFYTIDAGAGSFFTTSNYGRGGVQSAEIVSIDDQEPVRMGNHALKLNYDFRNCGAVTEGAILGTSEAFEVPGMPTAIGVWVYAPEGTGIKWEGDGTVSGLWLRGYIRNEAGENKPYDFTFEPKVFTGNDPANWPDEYPGIWWEGWHYCEADLTTIPGPYRLAAGAALRLMFVNGTMMGERTAGSIYFDNFQFIYGTNVDDVDPPVENAMGFNTTGLTTDEKDIKDGMTIKSNIVNFHTSLYDVQNKYTSGVDVDTVRVYIDGVSTYNNDNYQVNTNPQGDVWVSNVELMDGYHTLTLSAKDHAGNELNKTVGFYIKGETVTDTTLSIVPAESNAPLGGKVNLNIVASDAADVVDATIGFKLHSYFKNYTVVFNEDYEGTYSYNKLTKVITINATRKADATGASNVIATLSVNIPSDLKATDEFTYTASSGFYHTAAGNYRTFVTPVETLSIGAAYFPSTETIIAGTACTITVVDGNRMPAANVGIYLENGTLLGQTDADGRLTLDAFGTVAGTYKVYAQDAAGARSFLYDVNTYAAQGDATGMPHSVMNNAVSDNTTQKSITWMSNPLAGITQSIKYAPLGTEDWVVVNATVNLTTYVTGGNRVAAVNNVVLTGLAPNTTYRYVLGGGDVWSAEATFKTGDVRGTNSFFVLGDIQANDLTNINAILGLIAKENYQFGIQTGDAVDDGGNYQHWVDVAGLLGAGNIKNADLISVLGNHEFSGDATAHNATVMYNLPVEGYGAYYSVTYGDVYVAVINYTSTKSELNQALAWLVEDAQASNATWKVLTMHQPAYYTNLVGGNAEIHDVVPAAVDAAGIDFVFSGHDHSYARTAPLTGGQIDTEGGAVYFICGSSGEKSYDVTINPDFHFENTSDTYNAIYMAVEVTKWSFTVTTYDVAADGTKRPIDTYTKYISENCCENNEHAEYVYDEESGYVLCSNCKYEIPFSQYSGLYIKDGKYHYAVVGNPVSGWQKIDGEWHVFKDNGEAYTGTMYWYAGVKYILDKTGRLTSGTWRINESGRRYYYGPVYYIQTWATIDGDTYYFDKNGYAIDRNYVLFAAAMSGPIAYTFAEDGKFIREVTETGIFKTDEGLFYIANGSVQQNRGLIEIDTETGKRYIYVSQYGYLATGSATIYIGNGLVANQSVSVFDENGYAIHGFVTEEGKTYYYLYGQLQKKQMMVIDGVERYFDTTDGHMLDNEFVTLNGKKFYCIDGQIQKLPMIKIDGVERYFDTTDGHLLDEIVQENGSLYLYVEGVKQFNRGLVEIDVNGEKQYIYVRTYGQLAVGTYTVWVDNGFVPYASVQTFDENGYMIWKNGIVNEDGTLYYYINGEKQVNLGLIEIEDNGQKCCIYVRTKGELAVGPYTVWVDNGLVPYASVQTFDENGHMIDKNGIVNENGALYYYINGEKQVNLGLVEIEDNGQKCYIYVRTKGELAVGSYTVWVNNGLVPYASEQMFDENGHMILRDGIVNENGTLYYYINGQKQVNLGLIEIEDNGQKFYIYVRTKGELAVGDYTVWIDNGLVPYASNQTFDKTTGHMIVD